MRAKLSSLFAILVICGLAIAYDTWHQAELPPTITEINTFKMTPNFKFTAQNSKTYDFNHLPKTGIILHFWASWCVPCQVELPELLKQIQNAHGELALVAVSIDNSHEAMQKFIDQLPYRNNTHIYWIWDQNKDISLKTFNTANVPESILINSQHQMVQKIVGDPGWNSPDIVKQLNELAMENNQR